MREKIGLKAHTREKSWSRTIRDRGINELIDLTTHVLLPAAKKEVRRTARKSALKKLSGRGDQKRFSRLINWARTLRGPIIYSFWRRKHCLYIGKGNNWRRLMYYSKSLYLRDADHVRIYLIRGRSQLPKAECLFIHLLNPRDNKQKAAHVKWGKSCPICKTHDFLRSELKVLFD